ncbi:hypothetical protein [Bradyrhizobium sp. LTSP857]|uniref:hypothetical protein n=1 Tax=Bradyrhizobium sp. LTSP857 TaxID=1619231 RepID=UPI0005D16470|nr:hypothetical protein [Bradyrhizobium sp. LTSP857]KJC40053.1 hypothetical protein UP06_27310 [Bradyrhizobium sp. LTSP857]
MLRRIPAVKWAFARLRPLPHSGSIDVAPIVADEPPAVIVDAAPALDIGISTEALHNDADIAAADDDTTLSVIAESPSAAPADIQVSDESSRTALPEIEPIVEEQASVSFDVEPADIPELIIGSDPSAELQTDVEPVVAEEAFVSSVEVETASADVPAVSVDSEASPSVTVEIEPVLANDPLPITIVAADSSSADSPIVPTSNEPEPVLASPAPEIRSAPKARAKAAEPVDRATLIRQRWTETGIRMWNPRLHGTGDATLNIQGRVELLPPAPGENLPRYDKLEFKMLGGQIVCEGVIVDAPAQADKRSFTRLAEPGKSDRVREPVRERQAALA